MAGAPIRSRGSQLLRGVTAVVACCCRAFDWCAIGRGASCLLLEFLEVEKLCVADVDAVCTDLHGQEPTVE